MKKEIKGFVLGVLTTVVVGSGAAIAAGQFTSIDVVPNNVTIALNGQATNIPSFTYNNSTYVQLRPVLEGMGCGVTFDEATSTVGAYNEFTKITPAYIEDLNKTYELVSWAPTFDGSTGAKTYIDLDVLTDIGFKYLPNSVYDYGYHVLWFD